MIWLKCCTYLFPKIFIVKYSWLTEIFKNMYLLEYEYGSHEVHMEYRTWYRTWYRTCCTWNIEYGSFGTPFMLRAFKQSALWVFRYIYGD